MCNRTSQRCPHEAPPFTFAFCLPVRGRFRLRKCERGRDVPPLWVRDHAHGTWPLAGVTTAQASRVSHRIRKPDAKSDAGCEAVPAAVRMLEPGHVEQDKISRPFLPERNR